MGLIDSLLAVITGLATCNAPKNCPKSQNQLTGRFDGTLKTRRIQLLSFISEERTALAVPEAGVLAISCKQFRMCAILDNLALA